MQDNTTNHVLKVLAIWSLVIFLSYTLMQIGSFFMNLVTILGISIILTYILLEPVNWLERVFPDIPTKITIKNLNITLPHMLRNINKRVISIFIIYISFIILVIFSINQIIPPTIKQITEFASNLPNYAQTVDNTIKEKLEEFHEKFPTIEIPGLTKQLQHLTEKEIATSRTPIEQTIPNITTRTSSNNKLTKINKEKNTGKEGISSEEFMQIKTSLAKTIGQEIISIVQNNARTALDNVIILASGTLSGIGYSFTIFVLSFYFLLDGKRLVNGIKTFIPGSEETNIVIENVHFSLLGFLKGQVYLGILTGLFMWPVYTLFGVKYTIFLCLFLAIAEILPVIGSSIGFIPAIIVMLFTNPINIIPVWIIFFIFQSIKDNIIAPKIVGEIIGLHPVTVILSLWIGFEVAGFFGILFAIPIASVLNVIIMFILNKKRNKEDIPTSI